MENYSEDTNKAIENSLLKEQLQIVTTQNFCTLDLLAGQVMHVR